MNGADESRRRFLRRGVAVAAIGAAGCAGRGEEEPGTDQGNDVPGTSGITDPVPPEATPATLAPGDGEPREFGVAAALDGRTALVGAPPGLDTTGAAYVFEWAGDGWRQEATLTPEEKTGGFGEAVALSGDVALVGAPPSWEVERAGPGAVHVFERSGGAWRRTARLTPRYPDQSVRFGTAVDLDGRTALVGDCNRAESSIEEFGPAHVFDGTGEGWTVERVLSPRPAFGPYDAVSGFGWSVAVDGDAALVGGLEAWRTEEELVTVNSMPQMNVESERVPATYAFTRTGSGWVQETAVRGLLGWTVALSPPYALIGDLVEGESVSAVAVERRENRWERHARLGGDSPSGTQAAVALDGEVAVVGGGGSVHAFELGEDGWTRRTTLAPADGSTGFGRAVALEGTTALVGAAGEPPGAAHVRRV